jgi:hypothetical protein
MDEEEFRKLLITRNERHLDERVKRWKQLDPITYDGRSAPNLVFHYGAEAIQLFIDGYYLGVILLCAGIVEMVLLDQLMKNGMSSKRLKSAGLKELVNRAEQRGIVDDTEARVIYALNDLRNEIIHAKADQLIERGTGSFEEGLVGPSPTNYLRPFFGGRIDEDTLTYLTGIRKLIVKFHGVEE